MSPRDPSAAATHPEPYPFYTELVARRPLYRDDALGLWGASSARAVEAVRFRSRPALLSRLLDEVLRHDPPVQNTGRFLAEDAVSDGQAMAAGDGSLVLLAAANRAPALHPAPHRFDLHREPRRTPSFGQGGHACPGEALARSLALGGLEVLLATDVAAHPAAFADLAFLPSHDGRIPLLPALFLQEVAS
ncbi:cytochrome P450 [Myxococcus sp. K15C18031901]|uniref:cytochrome P450 n=1 Tax=Myxococcus dinghuensis TaxID=2906761 RepID=UPI0020A6E901|nr:cytochrome P450 [Myxococcus dinghuensis]MCP3105198.1 cytochrome P450 [Myxococcus dinghuensis]